MNKLSIAMSILFCVVSINYSYADNQQTSNETNKDKYEYIMPEVKSDGEGGFYVYPQDENKI